MRGSDRSSHGHDNHAVWVVLCGLKGGVIERNFEANAG